MINRIPDKEIMERAQEAMRQMLVTLARQGGHADLVSLGWDARRLLVGVIDRGTEWADVSERREAV